MTTAAWRVLIVEPDEIRMRHYMLELMQDSAFHLVATAPNKRRAILLIVDRTPVDLAVVNARLPDGCGAEITRAVLKKNPDAHILIATDVSEENTVMQSVEAGADGYILVTDDAPRIADSLKVMAAGGSPVSPLIARSVLRALHSRNTAAPAPASDILSRRELDIMGLLAKGLTLTAIAEILSISEHTVTTHVKKIYKKLNVHSRGEAVYEARQLHLIQ
ncbi:response regulator transcription factor [uncultured Duodenibacillus sp.]|uniref:LuxR C-terminal-related transcriptional regulator n=1 Tax=uncultured Duodenibacillus sp. TaxID=1980699 RepID=UPI002590C13C|nr:response regulator transcription factor [uncultured Duodenibacillus sp.]